MMFSDITGDEDYIIGTTKSTVEVGGPSSMVPQNPVLDQDDSLSEDDSDPTPKRQRRDDLGKTVVVVDSDDEHKLIRPSQPLSILSSKNFSYLQRASLDELKMIL